VVVKGEIFLNPRNIFISLFGIFRFLSYLGMGVVIQVVIINQDEEAVVEVVMMTTGN
jgi:hypothetical protein